MKNNKITIAIIFLMLAMPLILAETETYEVNKAIDLKFTCTLNNAIPSASATYNISITYSNGSYLVNNQETTAKGNGAFNYSLTFLETGIYKVQSFCIDGAYSYSSEDYYDITGNGKTTPTGSIVVFFSLALLVILGLFLFQLILSIGHLASLDLDVLDVAKSYGIYFAVLGIYLLNQTFLGDLMIDGWLLIVIRIGGFTHLIFPVIAFVLSITVGSLKKKKVDFGTRRILRRRKI